jgi:hypothetical protein
MRLRRRPVSIQSRRKPPSERFYLRYSKKEFATRVGQLFDEIPGAADLAQKHPVVVGAGGGVLGSLSGLASNVVGKDAGVLVAAIGQLEETNLTLEQIRKIGTAVLSYIKENTNPALAKEVVDSIPSLRERFGHQA